MEAAPVSRAGLMKIRPLKFSAPRWRRMPLESGISSAARKSAMRSRTVISLRPLQWISCFRGRRSLPLRLPCVSLRAHFLISRIFCFFILMLICPDADASCSALQLTPDNKGIPMSLARGRWRRTGRRIKYSRPCPPKFTLTLATDGVGAGRLAHFRCCAPDRPIWSGPVVRARPRRKDVRFAMRMSKVFVDAHRHGNRGHLAPDRPQAVGHRYPLFHTRAAKPLYLSCHGHRPREAAARSWRALPPGSRRRSPKPGRRIPSGSTLSMPRRAPANSIPSAAGGGWPPHLSRRAIGLL